MSPGEFDKDYWNRLFGWYAEGGDRHVGSYLRELDLSGFDPKAPPPKTQAFWDIVEANQVPEDAQLADVLDELGNPDATTVRHVAEKANETFQEWLQEPRNRRAIPHRFEKCGYISVLNPDKEDRKWIIHGKRRVVYAKSSLSLQEQIAAAQALAWRSM